MKMINRIPTPIVALTLILAAHLPNSESNSPNTNIIKVLCNSGTYSSGNPFSISLAYVTTELVETTPGKIKHDFYNISPYPNAFAYGHAMCDRNLTSLDCWICLGAAKVSMLSTCSRRIGGRVVLVDCGMRYEQYPFLE